MRLIAMGVLLSGTIACRAQTGINSFPPPCLSAKSCFTPVLGTDSSLPSGTIRGIVVDSSNGRPIQAQVGLGASRFETFVWTDNGGRFRLAGLPPGPDTLTVRMIGYQPRRIPIILPKSGGIWVVVPLPWSVFKVQ